MDVETQEHGHSYFKMNNLNDFVREHAKCDRVNCPQYENRLRCYSALFEKCPLYYPERTDVLEVENEN